MNESMNQWIKNKELDGWTKNVFFSGSIRILILTNILNLNVFQSKFNQEINSLTSNSQRSVCNVYVIDVSKNIWHVVKNTVKENWSREYNGANRSYLLTQLGSHGFKKAKRIVCWPITNHLILHWFTKHIYWALII